MSLLNGSTPAPQSLTDPALRSLSHTITDWCISRDDLTGFALNLVRPPRHPNRWLLTITLHHDHRTVMREFPGSLLLHRSDNAIASALVIGMLAEAVVEMHGQQEGTRSRKKVGTAPEQDSTLPLIQDVLGNHLIELESAGADLD
jgi:hypothetical protein